MGGRCPDEELLAAFVHRNLSGPSAQEVERHIDTCPACRAVVAELLRAEGPQGAGAPTREEDEAYLGTLPPSSPPSPRPPLLVPGATVGRFRILERIGGGGMGVVFAAHDPELDRKVALKLLRADLAQGAPGEEARARLLREAKAMARLAHPNVIGVHDVGALGEEIFLAVEFVDGQTLGAWVRERPRSWREVLAVYIQAGRGLAAAHEAGLVHRDFKPDNALVGRDGRVRVTDFGLVRSTTLPWPALTPPPVPVGGEVSLKDALTRAYQLLGTPGYMAPEQLEGRAADERSDQFSFCVALFEALFGERPFRGKNIQELRDAIRHAKPAFPVRSRVPLGVRRALARGLAPSPFDRHASMDALLRELESARRIARRWWYAAAGGAALAGVGALVALWPATREAAPLGFPAPSAEVSYARGVAEAEAGNWSAAEALFDEAEIAAEAARQDSIAAVAEIALAEVVGLRMGRTDEGLKIARRAQAKLVRLGGGGALQARLDAVSAQLRMAPGLSAATDAGGPTPGPLAR